MICRIGRERRLQIMRYMRDEVPFHLVQLSQPFRLIALKITSKFLRISSLAVRRNAMPELPFCDWRRVPLSQAT